MNVNYLFNTFLRCTIVAPSLEVRLPDLLSGHCKRLGFYWIYYVSWFEKNRWY